LPNLTKEHYSTFYLPIPPHHIVAEGAIKPSSEALTHASVYAANSKAMPSFMFTVDYMAHHQALALPAIDPAIQYGHRRCGGGVSLI